MSKIIISDDQNTVEVDGKKYVAVVLPVKQCCKACAFDDGTKSFYSCMEIPCCPALRTDETYVSFKLQK